MKVMLLVFLGALAALPVHAQDPGQPTPRLPRLVDERILREALRSPGRLPDSKDRRAEPSPLARAIAAAHHKGIVQSSFEGYAEVLIACQQETSQLLTTPFMHSDSQQAHCYRY